MATRIGLVACSAGKLTEPARARDLYTSPLFRKASAYAAQTCDAWFILSAKHGLLRPDAILAPYDQKLGDLPALKREDWARQVRAQLARDLRPYRHDQITLVALAGKDYRAALDGVLWPVEVPMRGLGIGQQLGFLTRELAALDGAK